MRKITPDDALEYHHLGGKSGKLAIVPTKPMATQHDLALAYSPGVAVPVLEIARKPGLAYDNSEDLCRSVSGDLTAVGRNMNRREAFSATVNHREPERVLVDYGKHIGSFHRLAYGRPRDYPPELDLPEQPVILDRMAQNISPS